MSILTRQWKEYDFLQIRNRNPWFITLLGNTMTLDERMADAFHDIQPLLKQYTAHFPGEPLAVTIFATDETMLWQFIDAEYKVNPSYVELTTITRMPIEIPHARRNPL